MNQLCFYPLALTASTLLAALAPASRPSLALWMLGALPVFFLYYARKRCKHLSVLLLLHGLVLACFYIIPAANGVNRGIRLLVGAGFVIYSLWLRFRTEDFASDPLPLPLAAGIAFLCLFLQHYQGNNVWDLYYRMSLILVFLLYAVILFLQSYEDFLTVNRLSTGKIPFSGDLSFRAPQHRSLCAVVGASAPGSVTVCLVKALFAVTAKRSGCDSSFPVRTAPHGFRDRSGSGGTAGRRWRYASHGSGRSFYFMGHSGICGHDRTSDRLRIPAVPRNSKADHISQGQNAVFPPRHCF